jgi:uncharacterized protein
MKPAWRALLVLALLWPALPAWSAPTGCPPVAVAPDAATLARWQAQARERGLLWRYEKDGRSGWLFGTMHVGRAEWSVPGPALASALAQADRLVLEIDPLAADLGPALREAPAAAAPAVPPALAARLQVQRQRACVGHQLDDLAPAMQALSLLALSGRAVGLDPAWGQEPVLSGRFHGERRPVESIETAAQQVDALMGDDDPLQALAQSLDELESPASLEVVRRLAEAWAAGDRATLADYPHWCRCAETPEQRALLDRVLVQRNARMAEHIERLHAAGARPVVAVGALHMVGDEGLPARLQRAGFRLTWLGPGAP